LAAARYALAHGQPQRLTLPDGIELFVNVLLPPPTLVIIGGVHIALALVTLAKTVGYRAVVVDPRAAFGNAHRFPHADQLLTLWPDEAFGQLPLTRTTAVAALTHDPKLDDPALQIALPSPAFYVGALGSQSTQAQRRARLLEAGIPPEALARLHGPIGLNLKAKSPEEIALAIMAEVVAVRNGEPS
jgi:xanthine dehydrogenase accessory factor